ncbi:Methyltransferase domain-containing protein [Flavobacteriaceae bacterium MAR_2010_188]|nr:Methyltransferase domain-containing protein [Flavobacteriaceae bacterium MAR_2010_188]
MRILKHFLISVFLLTIFGQCKGQHTQPEANYTYKTGSYGGTGKFYLDREIAQVMGYQGMTWLERSEREEEENTTTLLKNMDIQPGDNIADIGAGSGYHVFKMVPLANAGLIYAVDIQQKMLDAINEKKEERSISNISLIKGSENSNNLPENSVDKILMVDVYHELSYPVEMLASIKKALRHNGKLFLIEYRGEDPNIPIKKLHKMTEAQAVKELKANGFKLEKNIDNLPIQHCMVFQVK